MKTTETYIAEECVTYAMYALKHRDEKVIEMMEKAIHQETDRLAYVKAELKDALRLEDYSALKTYAEAAHNLIKALADANEMLEMTRQKLSSK